MKKKVVYANYDWDDNIIFMPTRIVFFAKNEKLHFQEVEVSTEVFAHVRSKVGVSNQKLFVNKQADGSIVGSLHNNEDHNWPFINLKDYAVDNDDAKGSFRQFRDCPKNYFMKHLKEAVDLNHYGPSFKDFQEHCSNEEEAENLCVITARGHNPKTIHEGMLYLQKSGVIKYCPKEENIYPCSYKGLKTVKTASAQNPSEAKKNILLHILDELNNKSDKLEKDYTFGFSDDDQKTMKLVEEVLETEVNQDRWSGFEINLYFTGNKIKERKMMLKSDQKKVA